MKENLLKDPMDHLFLNPRSDVLAYMMVARDYKLSDEEMISLLMSRKAVIMVRIFREDSDPGGCY